MVTILNISLKGRKLCDCFYVCLFIPCYTSRLQGTYSTFVFSSHVTHLGSRVHILQNLDTVDLCLFIPCYTSRLQGTYSTFVFSSHVTHLGSRVHILQNLDTVDLAVVHCWWSQRQWGEGGQETETETQESIHAVMLTNKQHLILDSQFYSQAC